MLIINGFQAVYFFLSVVNAEACLAQRLLAPLANIQLA